MTTLDADDRTACCGATTTISIDDGLLVCRSCYREVVEMVGCLVFPVSPIRKDDA